MFNRIGAEKLGWNLTELLRIGILVDKQSPDIAMGVDKGGAGDQGIMYGYATNETAEQMPIPYMVATKFLQLLKNHPSKMFRADAKAQVSYAMKYLMSAEWWKAAGIRAAKTMFQTGAALVVTQMPGGTVDWVAVGSAAIVAGVASLGTSLAGLPELEKQ